MSKAAQEQPIASEHEEQRSVKDQSQYDFTTDIDYGRSSAAALARTSCGRSPRSKANPSGCDFRLKGLETFNRMPVPRGGRPGPADFEEFYYYMRPSIQKRAPGRSSDAIKDTFEKLGIPKPSASSWPGSRLRWTPSRVYGPLKKRVGEPRILFVDMDTAVRQHPEIVAAVHQPGGSHRRQQVAALYTAFWSGGSFVYVPAGVSVEIPLQAYFRIKRSRPGAVRAHVIIAEEGSSVHYIEGCTAPQYTTAALPPA